MVVVQTSLNFILPLYRSITITKRALRALDLDEKGLRKSEDFATPKRATLVGGSSPTTPDSRDRSKSKSLETKGLSPFKKLKVRNTRFYWSFLSDVH